MIRIKELNYFMIFKYVCAIKVILLIMHPRENQFLKMNVKKLREKFINLLVQQN